MDELVRLVDIRESPLDIAEVIAAVDDRAHGAIATFIGNVRQHDGGKRVETLDYTAHPTALARLTDVCAAVAARHSVMVAAIHRVGLLEIGDAAVVIATSSGHRGTAFDAVRDLIDTLKAEVPIWKHQAFSDGTQEWVGTP